MARHLRSIIAFLISAVLVCGTAQALPRPDRRPADRQQDGSNDRRSNILLIIADDLGVADLQPYQDADSSGIYSGVTAASTPEIETLAASGVTFLNVWSNPTCTPTRAGIYSGLHAFTHDLTSPFDVNVDTNAPGSLEGSLSSLGLTALPGGPLASYQTGLFGKWHVGGTSLPSTCSGTTTFYSSPLNLGWDTHQGSWEDIRTDYCGWETVVDGACPASESQYSTDYIVEKASDWIASVSDEPWWATVAFNTPHVPLHDPSDCSTCASGDCRSCFLSMVESMDDALGQILSAIAGGGADELAETIVIFMGDNGTDKNASEACDSTPSVPYDRGHWKGTVYQGGVHVPLIIADGCYLAYGTDSRRCRARRARFGRLRIHNPGRTSDALAHTLDLFATIAQIANPRVAPVGIRDSISLRRYLRRSGGSASLREFVYTQGPDDTTGCAIRNQDWKMVVRPCEDTNADACEIYDLATDPLETDDYLSRTIPAVPTDMRDLVEKLRDLRGWGSTYACSDYVILP